MHYIDCTLNIKYDELVVEVEGHVIFHDFLNDLTDKVDNFRRTKYKKINEKLYNLLKSKTNSQNQMNNKSKTYIF